MRDRTIVGELQRSELTEENILRLAMHHGCARRRIPGIAWLLATLIVFFSVFGTRCRVGSESHSTLGNQSSILMLLALPMTLIIMDRRPGSVDGAVLGIIRSRPRPASGDGHALPLAFAAALGGRERYFDSQNGVLVVALGMPPFVATLGMLGVAQGIAQAMTNGESVSGIGSVSSTNLCEPLDGNSVRDTGRSNCICCVSFLLYHTRLERMYLHRRKSRGIDPCRRAGKPVPRVGYTPLAD
jgi:ribose transport system permease protein